jgi:hypothetical protein
MLPFKLIYSDGYYLPIGEHVFPAEKYRRIRDRLIASGVAEAAIFSSPNRLPIRTFCWSTRRNMCRS